MMTRGYTAKYHHVVRLIHRIPRVYKLSIGIAAAATTIISGSLYFTAQQYVLSPKESSLLTKVSVDTKYITEDEKSISYNRTSEKKAQITSTTLAGSPGDSTGQFPYKATLGKTGDKSITFSDSKGDLEFTMRPDFDTSAPKRNEGRVVYPKGLNESHVYTFKRNGIKEDIILSKAPGRTASYSWQLELGDKLEAKMMPNGSVGIYSASPYLFGNLSISDEKSQKLVDAARKADKTNLAFVIPTPYIKDSKGLSNYEDISFKLSGNTLTLEARNLTNKSYPISLDPSVVVTTNSEFKTGSDDGTISYPGAGNISRNNISAGTVGAWNTTTAFTTARQEHTSVAYNGYLYVIGGVVSGGTRQNGVQKAIINADGTVGTWTPTTAFTTTRFGHTSVAYNGYLYVIGGLSTVYQDDVQKAAIDPTDGTVGAWTATTSFTTARAGHTSVAYNGYLYVIGGSGGSYQSDVQKAAINADGTVGTWSTTTAFTTARNGHTSVAYNGYLYVIGGNNGTRQNDVQKAAIAADGTVGTWSTTTAFTTARSGHTSVAYNGYLYVIGGHNGISSYYSDVQKAAINADGTVGTWSTTTAFTTARQEHTSVAYNGYLYVIGGHSGSYQSDVQFSLVQPETGGDTTGSGGVGTWGSTTAFTTARSHHTSVAYNGYLYVMGGDSGSFLDTVQKAAINADGTVGTWTPTTAFTTGRFGHTSVAYNGYLYVIGGHNGSSFLDTVQKAAIDPTDGTVGTWSATTAFTTARRYHASVAYNGYLYVIGGDINGSYINDVQKAAIDSSGNVGTWSTTTAFTTGRRSHSSVAYNGYLYVIGGDSGSYQNDVQKAAIDSSGNVGTWSTTTAFTTARDLHISVAYNGYLYIIGGHNGTHQNDVQKAAIAADGTIGTWSTTTAFTTARRGHTSVAYNGYLYVIGGTNGTRQNDVQYTLIQPGASGTVGSVGATAQQTNAFTTARAGHTSVAYNGYLYVIGGNSGTNQNDVQHCPINANGSIGTCVQLTNAFTSARTGHTSVTYNGYLYIIGGFSSTYLRDIQRAVINGDGSLSCPAGFSCPTGVFTQQDNILNNGRMEYASVAYNGHLHITAGYNSTSLDSTEHCPINANGSIGTCVQQSGALTVRMKHTSVAHNGYLYVIGGSDGTFLQNDIQRAAINSDGSLSCPTGFTCTTGVFTQQTSAFTTARRDHTSVAYNGYLYIIGGCTTAGDPCSAWLNDIQRLPLNADGTVGAATVQAAAFTTARQDHTSVAYNGYLYVIGGNSGSAQNDVQHLSINSIAQAAHYERVIDIGKVADSIDSIQYNGTVKCGAGIQYAIAGSNGTFGTLTTLMPDAVAGVTYSLSGLNLKRYVRVVVTLTDQTCGSNSSISDLTVSYTLLPPPAPTLSAPISGAISTSLTPVFQFKSTDAADTYAQYKILVYQSNCSTLIRTIDQTLSQTGWSGQDAQTSTAYVAGTTLAASTMASHTYQTAALSYNTTYCWKAAAIDPGGSNTFGAYSATQLFTTNTTPAAPTLSQPVSAQTGAGILPEFRLYAGDQDNDYLKYRIEVCSTSNCSVIVRTIDQTLSQTGWGSQSQQSATAYSSGQTAVHTYQPSALTANTQYWWRAYAIDPAGTNTFSVASSIGTFTTQTSTTPSTVNITGNTTIYGGSTIAP